MDINKISAGNLPDELNVIIEIPMDSNPVKYEFDKESGAIMVDRFISVSMCYPCNYGFVPHTLGGDGDPIDVLVLSSYPVVPGAVIKCRPVGVLLMEDESGQDEKIIAVPLKKLDVNYADIEDISDIKQSVLDKISHFFERYKDLEKNKWVKIMGWADSAKAKEVIMISAENFKK
jgi:inorganic pyrophosphatase